MFDVMCLVLIRLLIYFKRFLFSLKRHFLASLLNGIEVSTQILIFICLIKWIQLVFNPDFEGFNVEDAINSNDTSIFSKFETQAKNFDSYRTAQGFTICSMIFQTMKYFYYSKRMAKLLDVFNNSKFDFLFFITVFFIFLIAFSLIGYFSFGVDLEEFNSFGKSLLNCVILLIGKVDLNELINSNYIIGSLFYFSFMVILYKYNLYQY